MELQQKTRLKRQVLDQLTSWLFVLPVVLGILLFTMLPMISSLYYSFTNYSTMAGEEFLEGVGFRNYIDLFTIRWPTMGRSLGITAIYSVITVPLNLVLSFALALPLARQFKGVKLYRTLIYAPVLIPSIVSGYLWLDLTSSTGHFNQILEMLNLPTNTFFNSADTAMQTFIVMGLFTLGGSMVLWIAQMKAIPETMYEAARIEGAGYFRNLFTITIPMCSPMIFYNLILSIINGLQTYSTAIVVSNHLNFSALDFFVGRIYSEIVDGGNLGFGSALSWVLFVIIAVITGVTFKFNKWVYYEEEA